MNSKVKEDIKYWLLIKSQVKYAYTHSTTNMYTVSMYSYCYHQYLAELDDIPSLLSLSQMNHCE